MRSPLYNSFLQSLLVRLYGRVSSRLDLNAGLLGRAYIRAYLAYKTFLDRTIVATARRLAQPGTLVIDVGANIGFFSLAMMPARDVDVLAFEPDPRNCAQLKRLSSDPKTAGRIHTVAAALSDHTGSAELFLSDLAPTDHKLFNTRSSTSIPVQCYRLDDFLALHPAYNARPIALIKIDVQGAELMVLRGMIATLERHHYPPILVEYAPTELSAAGTGGAAFFEAFANIGYQPHTIPDMLSRDPAYFSSLGAAYTDLVMLALPPKAPRRDAGPGGTDNTGADTPA